MAGIAREPLVSMQEVAAYLGVPLETVRHWRKHRTGPRGFLVGRYVKFRLSDVDRWLETRREDV